MKRRRICSRALDKRVDLTLQREQQPSVDTHSPQVVNCWVQDRRPSRREVRAAMKRHRLLLAVAVWAGFGLVCLIGEKAHADVSAAAIKEWLRVHIATCVDVRTVVAAIGEARAESGAKTSGVSETQIARAQRCLK